MEDIAIHEMNGASYIYLGDIGNSDFDKDIFTIYRWDTITVNISQMERGGGGGRECIVYKGLK